MIVEVTFLLNLNKTFSHVVRRFGKHCIQLKICIFLNSDTLFIFFCYHYSWDGFKPP
jgi:hypothetical protein